MGYDREDITQNFVEKKEKTPEELINLIRLMDETQKEEELRNSSLKKLKEIKKRLDQKVFQRYEKRYIEEERERLYEYEDELYETDGYHR